MEEFSWLVGQIYDTVVDPARWTAVLGFISDYTAAARVTLILEDAIEPLNSVLYMSYADPDWMRRYLQDYMLVNPMRIARGSTAASGDVILTTDFMSTEEYARSRLSRELLAEKDLVDVAAAVLERTATSITVLSLKRSRRQGFADEELRRRLTLIAPHVRRAAAIGRVMEQRTMEAATLADTLDKLTSAVFLVDASGLIVHANSSARRALDRGDVLRDVGGRLVPRDPAAGAALAEAVTAACGGDTALGVRGVAVPFSIAKDKGLFGTVMPMSDGPRRKAGARYRAVAAICVRETIFETPSAVAMLAEFHDLTPRELSVLVAVVEVGGVSDTAAALGLSQGTVKSHLKAIFRKTGAMRQAGLVKLVAGMSDQLR